MSEQNKDAQAVLQWIQLGTVLLPQVMNLVLHYRQLSQSDNLSTEDKEQMKVNLRALKLPSWEEI